MNPNIFHIAMELSIIIAVFLIVFVIYKNFNKFQPIVCKEDIIKDYLTLEKESCYNKEVIGILVRLKIELSSTKVALHRFHNGGKFANGLDMKKFTTTHETASDNIEPFMDKNIGILNSRYPVAFEILAITGMFAVSDVEDCIDLNFKSDMKKYGFKSCYIFLIRQANGIHEGFIGINFNHTEILNTEKRHIVEECVPRILSLINMVK